MHVVEWKGESGEVYGFQLFKITEGMDDEPGCYVFMKTDGKNWQPVFPPGGEAFMEADDLRERMERHPNANDIIDGGATHIGVYSEPPNRYNRLARRFIVRDLNASHPPRSDDPF